MRIQLFGPSDITNGEQVVAGAARTLLDLISCLSESENNSENDVFEGDTSENDSESPGQSYLLLKGYD